MESKNKLIFAWLIAGCVLIFSMVIIGGITRLTGSGLSITEWNVIMGTFPPMNDAQWQDSFVKYQSSPQFQKVNFDMDLSGFKAIFFWEYLHRLIGRMIGLVFILPFGYFLFKKWFDRQLLIRSVIILGLGGLQGLLGWLMVKSGLVDNPRVSHYRLAAHLLTAFFTFGFTFWVALDHYQKSTIKTTKSKGEARIAQLALFFFVGVVLQILYGAFVAGLHAGRIYNTWPLMEGSFMAEAVTAMDPFWKNFAENLAGVQFIHRCLAYVLSGLAVYLYIQARKTKNAPVLQASHLVLGVLTLQIIFGITTLLLAVPVWLGVLHQAFAFLLFGSSIFLIHRSRGEAA